MIKDKKMIADLSSRGENKPVVGCPVRVQRKRTKGWKMPKNTKYVGRPSKYGNPYHVVDVGGDCYNVIFVTGGMELLVAWALPKDMALKLAIEKFREGISLASVDLIKKELRGKNLACFCPVSEPCHADILLKLANG